MLALCAPPIPPDVPLQVLHYDPAQSPVPRRHTPDAGLASSRSESDIFAPTERRLGLTVKVSCLLRPPAAPVAQT